MQPEGRRHRRRDENLLFFKRALRNPRALGSLIPSSPHLARFIAKHLERDEDEFIVEIGAGTGCFTDSFIKSGVAPENLYVIELDPELAIYLKKRFPKVNIIQGNANDLVAILPPAVVGKVRTVVSGIPMVNLTKELQNQIVKSCFAIMGENGKLLQFTYAPVSPISSRKLSLQSKLIGFVFLNFPPANIWCYRRLGPQIRPIKVALTGQWRQRFSVWRRRFKR